MKRFIIIVVLLWASIANAQLIGPGAGGSSFNPASPGAIGGTTPSTGTFTALTSGTAGTADPAIQLNNSSANQTCIFYRGATDYICDTNGAGMIFNVSGSTMARMFNGGAFQPVGAISSNTAAAISGGGALATGSNSFAGRITGLAATSNILTPGFTCANAVTCAFEDDTTAGGVKVTAQGTATITFSATASDTADYVCGCR